MYRSAAHPSPSGTTIRTSTHVAKLLILSLIPEPLYDRLDLFCQRCLAINLRLDKLVLQPLQ
jgi:hypothetical protein